MVEMSFRAFRAGLTITEVPIVFTDRAVGVSKMSREVIIESVLAPWKLRFRRSTCVRPDALSPGDGTPICPLAVEADSPRDRNLGLQ